MLTLHCVCVCSAARGLLTTDHVILNHGQVMRKTPELEPFSPNYNTTPMGGLLCALDRFNVHRSPTRWVFSGTGLELVTSQPQSDTLTTRLLWPLE
ncbi:hypothetical protein TNCV_545491 [Trichonephila clavipes]|nr:hypothetical protein TNCV_545491 [Trichonephila clavipes]